MIFLYYYSRNNSLQSTAVTAKRLVTNDDKADQKFMLQADTWRERERKIYINVRILYIADNSEKKLLIVTGVDRTKEVLLVSDLSQANFYVIIVNAVRTFRCNSLIQSHKYNDYARNSSRFYLLKKLNPFFSSLEIYSA